MTALNSLALCLYCGRELIYTTFGSIAWEPDYDSSSDNVTWRHKNGYAACPTKFAKPRPVIVVLCGSTRFKQAWYDEGKRLTYQGKIVLSVGDLDTSESAANVNTPISGELKEQLDILHKRKIDLADYVFILNVKGYIGKSTQSEIDYALEQGKPIHYLEEIG